MKETIATKDILHVHYWIHTGEENNIDEGSIVYLYRCLNCNKVKRQ
jgi:hypothetical protein